MNKGIVVDSRAKITQYLHKRIMGCLASLQFRLLLNRCVSRFRASSRSYALGIGWQTSGATLWHQSHDRSRPCRPPGPTLHYPSSSRASSHPHVPTFSPAFFDVVGVLTDGVAMDDSSNTGMDPLTCPSSLPFYPSSCSDQRFHCHRLPAFPPFLVVSEAFQACHQRPASPPSCPS